MDASLSTYYTKCSGYDVEIDSDGNITINVPSNNAAYESYYEEKLYFSPDDLQKLASTAKSFRDRRTYYLAHNK